MCGIVSYWGQGDAVNRVLEALRLLQYRAPDSSGIAVLDAAGKFVLRRSVGGPQNLVRKIDADPLFIPKGGSEDAVRALLQRQELDLDPAGLRDCSNISPARLFDRESLQVGVGDRGGGAPASAERDVVAFAFQLLGARVAARAAVDGAFGENLDDVFRARVPQDRYSCWREAWCEELAANVPGHAFAVAARSVQQSIPGLSQHLTPEAWERVGGLTALALSQMVMGHGRWAMVGAVAEKNAHPLPDRSRSRIACENGSHNARLMLGLREEQEAWWRARGLDEGQDVHRSENTTEVVAYEWERMRAELDAGSPPPSAESFLEQLDEWSIEDPEERALRLAMWRIREGNAHACALYSRHCPEAFYVSSHHKPVAIITRTVNEASGPSRQDVMVASDVNAGLMLWTDAEVDAAAEAIRRIQVKMRRSGDVREMQEAIDSIISHFTVDVVFLDADLFQGAELLARISNRVQDGNVLAQIDVSRYDGTPLSVKARRLALDPTMVGKGGFDTYIESHIAEIPDVLDGLVRSYVGEQGVNVDSTWQEGALSWPGLNVTHLQARFGQDLSGLQRILLLGEGSSWRDAQTAAPLFRALLPQLTINVYRPVELLNLGIALDPAHDLAIEISWSGTTDSLLKVDALLAELGLLRLAITGRAQSDLGRRAAASGGVLDVRSGVEVSVATVKGFQAILMTLSLLALRLAELNGGEGREEPETTETAGLANRSALLDELSLVAPRHVRRLISDEERRERIREVAHRCRRYNKVVVVGASPIDLEGELKIEELAQVVGLALDFHATSLRPLIERAALVDTDAARPLFVFNVTSPQAHAEARPLIAYLKGLDLFCVIHTTPHAFVSEWRDMPNTAVFETPQLSPHLQPLLDAPFFFDFAVALAYARQLSPAEIDSPRNLAKSVTTTGAERRSAVEARPELRNITLAQFAQSRSTPVAWDARKGAPTRAAFAATVALRAALSVLGDPLPERLDLTDERHLLVICDTEATENGAHMAAAAWQELLGIDLVVYRRFISSLHQPAPDTAWLKIVRAGAVLSLRDAHTVALPGDMSPLQLELLNAVYLTGLAIRLARRRGQDVTAWERGLAQMPLLVDEVLSDPALATKVTDALAPYLRVGYDKVQIIGGGQDYAAAASMARSLRMRGFVAEELYTDSAWHGPLATVGGGDAEHDTLIIILATDPLFQAAALVDTQVYRTRNAPVILLTPQGNEEAPTLRDVQASIVIAVPACPRPFLPLVNAAFGAVLARQMATPTR